jgi:hypothetical protein
MWVYLEQFIQEIQQNIEKFIATICWQCLLFVCRCYKETKINCKQCWPLGGVSGALALGADFEGAPNRQSPTGHMLIRSTVAWCWRSQDKWKYAWLAQITFQFCLRSVVDASWSRFVPNLYLPGGVGGANCSLCPGCPMGKGRPWLQKIYNQNDLVLQRKEIISNIFCDVTHLQRICRRT